jgi:hypothetical protein
MGTVTDMPEDAPKFTIAEHLDPDREISRNADPLVEYTSYLSDVRSGTVGDMGFTLADFERYIASLRERRPLG